MRVVGACEVVWGSGARKDRVCVGTPYAGREAHGRQDLVGYFVNPLAVVCDVRADDPSFVAVLGRVRAAVLRALEHADVPFHRVFAVPSPHLRPHATLRSPLRRLLPTQTTPIPRPHPLPHPHSSFLILLLHLLPLTNSS